MAESTMSFYFQSPDAIVLALVHCQSIRLQECIEAPAVEHKNLVKNPSNRHKSPTNEAIGWKRKRERENASDGITAIEWRAANASNKAAAGNNNGCAIIQRRQVK